MNKAMVNLSLIIAITLSLIFLFKNEKTLILPNALDHECLMPRLESVVKYKECITNNPFGCEYELIQRKKYCPTFKMLVHLNIGIIQTNYV